MFYRRRVGVGKVLGAVFGAFIMGVMNNGMSIMGIGIDYQQVIKGLVLLATVWVDEYNHAYPVGHTVQPLRRSLVRGCMVPRRMSRDATMEA